METINNLTTAEKRTYFLLRNTLMELLCTTPFEKITLTKICSIAMIPRSTFYRHFEDKMDLLRCCVRDFFSFAQITEQTLVFHAHDEIRSFLIRLIRLIEMDRATYQNILQVQQKDIFMDVLKGMAKQNMIRILEEAQKNGQSIKLELPVFTYLLTDFYFSIIQGYLDTDETGDVEAYVDNVCRFISREWTL